MRKKRLKKTDVGLTHLWIVNNEAIVADNVLEAIELYQAQYPNQDCEVESVVMKFEYTRINKRKRYG